jgi:hypothetical protein
MAKMTLHFDVERLRNEISHLLRAYPELEEDGILKADMIEAETSLLYVMDHLLRTARDARAMSDACHDEMAMITKRQERFDTRNLAMRKLMFFLMDLSGQKRIERPLGTISVANGKPKVIITDENQLPEQFVRIKKEPDKRLIESHLKAGDDVPGAALSNAEPYLRIG